MGTMDIITLDDTIDNDSSLFIIDETPMPIENGINKENFQKRKRRWKNKNHPQKKKKNMDLSSVPQADYVLLGSCLGGPSQTDRGSTSCFHTSNDSILNSSLASSSSTISNLSNKKAKRKKKKKRKSSGVSSIVILSDNEDDKAEEDVISISDDDEVGVIGGNLSMSVVPSFPKTPYNGNFTPKPPMDLKKKQNGQPFSIPEKKVDNSRKLRPIVIDGSNVAFGHAGQGKGVFSSKGIELCCEHFLKLGHTVKVFIPQFRRRHPATTDTHILDKLEKNNILVFTPSRKVAGKQVVSYDDRYIVEYATKCGGVIVSRDNFNDLISENDDWRETIHKRLLMFTWVDDVLMFPHDPLGRDGPPLEEFLSFPPEGKSSGNNKKAQVTFTK